jgi:monoamine oxidase
VALNALRSKLPATQRQGFDLALAALQGAKTKPPAVVTKNPAVLGGYVTMKGLEARGATTTVIEARDRVGGRNWTMRRGSKLEMTNGTRQVCDFDADMVSFP